MYKSLGEFTWAGILKSSNSSSICTDMCPLSEAPLVDSEVEFANTTPLPPVATTILSSMPASDSGEHIHGEDFNILESANAIHAQWISLKNVSKNVMRYICMYYYLMRYIYLTGFQCRRIQRFSRLCQLVELFYTFHLLSIGYCVPIIF